MHQLREICIPDQQALQDGFLANGSFLSFQDEQAIYFTEDGQAMTYEEYKFLKENLGEESSDEGDMPDDVEAAFEEFLNQNRS